MHSSKRSDGSQLILVPSHLPACPCSGKMGTSESLVLEPQSQVNGPVLDFLNEAYWVSQLFSQLDSLMVKKFLLHSASDLQSPRADMSNEY